MSLSHHLHFHGSRRQSFRIIISGSLSTQARRLYSTTDSSMISPPRSSNSILVTINSVKEFESYVQSKGPRAFVSGFEDPYLNLALESYIFKHMPVAERSKRKTESILDDKELQNNNRLLLYVNKACVVVGRNQNPWRECNVPLLQSLGVPLLRRRSGGGTVVHDGGNINFSIMTHREDFTRDKHANMIVDSVNKLPTKVNKVLNRSVEGQEEEEDNDGFGGFNMGAIGGIPVGIDGPPGMGMGLEMPVIPTPFGDGVGSIEVPRNGAGLSVIVNGPQIKLSVNERHDIIDAESREKVSGSAYKIERQKAYHHGTMLLNSRLDVLRALLHRDVDRLGTVEGRGVESVKSPVVNLGIDKDVFISTILDAFAEKYSPEKEENMFEDLIPVDHLEEQNVPKNTEHRQADNFLNPLTAGIDYDVNEAPSNEDISVNLERFDTHTPGNKELPVVLVNPEYLPEEIYQNAKETMTWGWIYGQTPDFVHTLKYVETTPIGGVLGSSSSDELTVKFKVSKGMLTGVELDPATPESLTQFQFVKQMIGQKDGLEHNQDFNTDGTSKVRYVGKEIAGFVPNDEISQWIGNSIDGTQLH